MNDIQLKYIIKAVEAGSLNKVAEYYKTNYQTVSYQIENLEEEFGVKFFTRNNKGSKLTNEGELVYQFAKNTMDNYDSLHNNISSLCKIRIGVDLRHIPSDFINYVSDWCPFPTALIPIHYEDMYKELHNNSVDCYIGYDRGEQSDLAFTPLISDFIGIALSIASPLSSKDKILFDDLKETRIHIGKFIWNHRNDFLKRIKTTQPTCMVIEEENEAIAFAEIYANKAFAVLPLKYSFIFNDSVKVIPFEDETITFGLYSLSNKKAVRLKNAIQDFLKQHEKN